MKIISTESFEECLAENSEQFTAPAFSQYLKELCENQHMEPYKLAKDVDIDRVYGYKIFSGERMPSREYVLKLALGLELTVDETNRLLILSKNSPLYPRIPRDAAIMYCLHHKFGYQDTQDSLHGWEMSILGEKS